jgi:hypothetical protein
MTVPLSGMHLLVAPHVGVGPVAVALAVAGLLAAWRVRGHAALNLLGVLAVAAVTLAFATAEPVGVTMPVGPPAAVAGVFGAAARGRAGNAVAFTTAGLGAFAADILMLASWHPAWDLMVVGGAGLADALLAIPAAALVLLAAGNGLAKVRRLATAGRRRAAEACIPGAPS